MMTGVVNGAEVKVFVRKSHNAETERVPSHD
jgi:hypothetical protein